MAKQKSVSKNVRPEMKPKRKKVNGQKIVVYLIIGVFVLSTLLMGIGTLL